MWGYGSGSSLQPCSQLPKLEVREHARVVCNCWRCGRTFPTGLASIRDDNSDLPESSLPHLPLTLLLSNCFILPWIYFLWQLPTSGRSFPLLIPREDYTDPCLGSSVPLPKPHSHCLCHSTKFCCALLSTCWSSLQKQLHFLRDTKMNPFPVAVYVSVCAGWDPLGLKLLL